MFIFAATICLSSFLLFQVQPIIAKLILPWFGGSAAVWNTCMLFFQCLLLGGYTYAHLIFERTSEKHQARLHVGLLLGAVLLLPIIPSHGWKPQGADEPIAVILGLLTVTIGLPYFMLATTGPLLQAWYAREFQGVIPYRLFALSNVASLAALVTYPVFIEPNIDLDAQAWLWSGCFVAFVFLCGYLAWRSQQFPRLPDAERLDAPVSAPTRQSKAFWILLAAVPSMLMLTVTSHLTQDIAAIPFLWIVPLALYLLTFILCFETTRLYWRWPYVLCSFFALWAVLWAANLSIGALGIVREICLFCSAMFVCSMVCHGELSRTKPHPRYLTSFYLCLSLGGALGGLCVGMIAPTLFDTYAEFPIGWWCAGACIVVSLLRQYWTQLSQGWKVGGVLLTVCGLTLYAMHWLRFMEDSVRAYDHVSRNFYGRLSILNAGEGVNRYRKMVHGGITHGQQFLDDAFRREPASYYCRESGVGQVFLQPVQRPRRVAIVGVGAGTLASYGRPNDDFHLFEINPQVIELARKKFTYLEDSEAHLHVHLGDARLMLERLDDHLYDIIVLDAFSSDAIPVHLVTREAY